MQNTITCPHCKKEFELDQVFRHQVEEDVKKKTEAELAKKFEEKNKIEMQDLQKQLTEQKTKNDELRNKELELRENSRKLEEDKKEFELKIQRELDSEKKKIEEKVFKEEEEKHHLKDLEKEKVIEDLKKALDSAQRKANQGSQQTQGEAFELEFEELLRREFPNDTISEVAKGVRGGDITQEIIDRNGVFCGKVLWELKNTKAWSELWVDKLKTDQRSITAESAVIISEAVPDGVESAKFHKGIWITKRSFALGLAYSLRLGLIQIAMAKRAVDGKKEKTDILFTYLSGTEFKHRVEAILEAWTSMQTDIEKEKRYFAGKWARDDKNIRQVIDSTIGMRGDLEGIMGNVLPEIKGLDLLEDGKE
ncbi:MAG: DUF2130 domain-containing protein [Candidatus Levyibacteriota bacterium]